MLKDKIKQFGLIKSLPDIAHMAQEIRQKRKEETGDENSVDDTAERVKNGIARKARKTKASLFGRDKNV
jgi:hypothetical protein